MARNPISMPRLDATHRRAVINHPYTLKYPGTNSVYMTIGTDVYKYERTEKWTVGAWIMPVDYAAGSGRHIFAEFQTGAPFRGWLLRIDTSGILRFWLINTFGSNELKVNYAPPPIGQPTRVIVTYDGSSTAAGVKCWFNGALQPQLSTTETLSATIVAAGAVVSTLGGWAGNLNPWKGWIGKSFIDHRQWTQTEVDADWYGQIFSAGTPTDNWQMSEGSGTSVASSGTGAHTGTLGATVTWDSANVPMKSRSIISQSRLSVS